MLKPFALFSVAGAGLLAVCALLSMHGASPERAHADDVDAAPTTAEACEIEIADDLVVHEWGTFTSFSGSDGLQLEFRPLVHGELPSFVIDPYYQAYGALTKSFRSFQRMETPVIYFYAPREMEVDVRVDFPQGLLTEYYPPVSAFAPSIEGRTQIRQLIDAGQLSTIDWDDPSIGGSSLTWNNLTLIPESLLLPHVENEELASVIQKNSIFHLVPYDEGNHYGHARATDAALVLMQPSRASESSASPDESTEPVDSAEALPSLEAGIFETPEIGEISDAVWTQPQFPMSGLGGIDHYFEKFLFYRGIGNLSLPFEANFISDQVIQVRNTGEDEIASVFLVVSDGTEEGLRFSHHRGLAGSQGFDLPLDGVNGSLEELIATLTQALIEDGLYEREAQAMVATWRDSWFLEPGTRLFYLVPHRTTEELLPLQIAPRPKEIVRVMVGRMEMMTPGHESQIIEAVAQSALRRQKALVAGENTASLPIPEAILVLGRWAEPALVRVREIADEAVVRNEAQTLITQLREIAAVASQDLIVPQDFLNLQGIELAP